MIRAATRAARSAVYSRAFADNAETRSLAILARYRLPTGAHADAQDLRVATMELAFDRAQQITCERQLPQAIMEWSAPMLMRPHRRPTADETDSVLGDY